MSSVGKEKVNTRGRALSKGFFFDNIHDAVEGIFHKDSFMKQLKALANGEPDPEMETLQLSEKETKQLSEFLLNMKQEKWEHSQIYSWVDVNAEAKVISQYKATTKGDVRERERQRYNAGLRRVSKLMLI